MSVGPSAGIMPNAGVVASAAGTGMAQASGSDAVRSRQAVANQQRQLESLAKADETAGIAKTDGEDQETNDRDADGRMPWHLGAVAQELQLDDAASDAPHPAKDASGESGNQLDLTG
jgi:hypothetical protein